MSENNTNGEKKPGFFRSVILTAIIAAVAVAVVQNVESVPYLAVIGVALLLVRMMAPWVSKNLGPVGLPIAALVLVGMAFVPADFEYGKYMPSKEQLTSWVPNITWGDAEDKSTESSETEEQEQTSSGYGESYTSTESSDSEAGSSEPTITPVPVTSSAAAAAPVALPSAPKVRIRPEVDTAIKADAATLAVIQKSDKWASWLSYSVWVKKELSLEADSNEWIGLREGLTPASTSSDEVSARRVEMLSSGGISINEEGYAVGENEAASSWIKKIYTAYQQMK